MTLLLVMILLTLAVVSAALYALTKDDRAFAREAPPARREWRHSGGHAIGD